jgi:tRNA threonylcarbamoyl adenosine modification protein (Sua5/YciO/YrdC/YwlC family)
MGISNGGNLNVIRVNPRRISKAAMKAAARILRRGGLVVYPTETVYGLGVNALDGQAVGRVFRVKGRTARKPLIVLVRDFVQLKELVDEVPPRARTLMGHFWPDGLTLIMSASPSVPQELLAGGTSIAIRISGHPVVQALLDAAEVPLTSSSANRSGRPAPITAAAAQREMGGRVDLIIDGGPSQGNEPSTILDVRTESVRLVRPGRISADVIRKVVPLVDDKLDQSSPSRTILFVCTGNTCRSAMAQGLLRKMLLSRNIKGVEICSAGIRATQETEASTLARQVALDEDGIDISRHRAQPLTHKLLESADIVFAMALSHARHIESMGRKFARKTFLLTSYPSWEHPDPEDIEDPIGGTREDYRRVYGRIKEQLKRILPTVLKEFGATVQTER